MIKYICDRCGKEVTENYYTCAFGCMTDRVGMITAEGAALNCTENSRRTRMLCYECMSEIRNFADKKVDVIDRGNDYEKRKSEEITGRISKRNNINKSRWLC